MQVVACIKQVPDTTQVQIDPVTNTLVREGIPFIVNPYDTHALEESLRLKDRYGLRVTAMSMGPAQRRGHSAQGPGARSRRGNSSLRPSLRRRRYPGHQQRSGRGHSQGSVARRRGHRHLRQADHRWRHRASRARHCHASGLCANSLWWIASSISTWRNVSSACGASWRDATRSSRLPCR